MKHLKLLSTSILIVLALLLSGAKSLNAQPSPSPRIKDARQQGVSTANQDGTAKHQDDSIDYKAVIKSKGALKSNQKPKTDSPDTNHKWLDTWSLSDKIAGITAVASFLQFIALIATISLMKNSSRRQLRAYVLPESFSIFDGTRITPAQPQRTDVPGTVLIAKNCGQTPAYKVASWMDITVIPIKDEANLTVPKIEERFFNTLGSNAVFNKSRWFDRQLTREEITGIREGLVAVYCYGRIVYRDAFKKRRFTNFRMRYNGIYPPLTGAIFNFCESGNDAN
jgi:hypothetical protein